MCRRGREVLGEVFHRYGPPFIMVFLEPELESTGPEVSVHLNHDSAIANISVLLCLFFLMKSV